MQRASLSRPSRCPWRTASDAGRCGAGARVNAPRINVLRTDEDDWYERHGSYSVLKPGATKAPCLGDAMYAAVE